MKFTAKQNIVATDAIPDSRAKPMTPSVVARLRPFMRPVLAFFASPQLLTSRGIRFTREVDDLDAYRIARYEVAGVLTQFQAYDHSEKDQITVYVDVLGADRAKCDVAQIAVSLMVALHLTEVHVSWTNEKFPVPLILHLTKVQVEEGTAVVQAKKSGSHVARKGAPAVGRAQSSRHTREAAY